MNAVTIGSAVCDITLSGNALAEHLFLEKKDGIKIPIEGIKIQAGGGAINSALIMRKIGLTAHPVCCVANDPFNYPILETLARNKISAEYIKISDNTTTALSFLVPHKDNQTTILTYKGAGTELDYQWTKVITKTVWDLIYIAPISGPLSQSLVQLVNQIQQKNPSCIVAHNPNPHQLRTTMPEQKKLLPLLNLYILNYQEAEIAWQTEHAEPFNLNAYLQELAEIAPECLIVVTQGIHGLDWQKGKERSRENAQKIQQLHSVGAGDSCGATIATALAYGDTPQKAVYKGMRVAEQVLTSSSIEAIKNLEGLF